MGIGYLDFKTPKTASKTSSAETAFMQAWSWRHLLKAPFLPQVETTPGTSGNTVVQGHAGPEGAIFGLAFPP